MWFYICKQPALSISVSNNRPCQFQFQIASLVSFNFKQPALSISISNSHPCQFQFQTTNFKVCHNCSRCQWPIDSFPFKVFLFALRCLCWLWRISIRESKFSWITYGLQWYMGWRWSTLVFAFSSMVTSVGNGSIRVVTFMWCLGCLNIKKISLQL